jgi:26S proteasome regulatory subunit T1
MTTATQQVDLTDGRNRDIQVLKTYGAAPYGAALKKLEQQIKEKQASVNEKIGVKVWMRRVTAD